MLSPIRTRLPVLLRDSSRNFIFSHFLLIIDYLSQVPVDARVAPGEDHLALLGVLVEHVQQNLTPHCSAHHLAGRHRLGTPSKEQDAVCMSRPIFASDEIPLEKCSKLPFTRFSGRD